ncbi:MAG: phospho-N-acetylmuramoyl-pentapeptide-transferase, partial [Endomicrobiia bacterium]
MFYHIFYPLKSLFSPFNVFGYITFRSMLAILTSLILSFIFGNKFISWLKKVQIIQSIRSDGPPTHQKKTGTPTMGGLIILFTLLISTLLWARLDNRFIIFTILSVIWLGFLGFLDDYLKIIKKNPKGISAGTKLLGQLIFALAVSFYLYFFPSNPQFSTVINIPYLKDVYINLGIFY